MTQRATVTRTAVLAAILTIAAAGAFSAQTPSTISDRVRDAMLAQERGWQLDDRMVENTKFWHRWKNRAEVILIDYEEHASDAAAAEWIRKLPANIPVPGNDPVPGIGDEAVIWTGHSPTGSASLYFRKGKTTGQVSAPSQNIAKRIALLVANQIYP
jgi:hypothetical protein